MHLVFIFYFFQCLFMYLHSVLSLSLSLSLSLWRMLTYADVCWRMLTHRVPLPPPPRAACNYMRKYYYSTFTLNSVDRSIVWQIASCAKHYRQRHASGIRSAVCNVMHYVCLHSVDRRSIVWQIASCTKQLKQRNAVCWLWQFDFCKAWPAI
jgi:hypothetical protein